LARVEDPDVRLAAARDVLTTARPLTFAHLCFQSMRPQRDGLDILIQDTDQIEMVLADRIAEFGQRASLFRTFPEGIDWLILLYHWQKNRGSVELHAYYRRVLQSDPRESVALVRSQLGLYIPGPYTNDFQAEHYKNLVLLANPDDVYRTLAKIGGSELTPEYAKLIKQFKTLHERQQNTPASKVDRDSD